MKLQRTFVLIYTTERRVQGNIAQKNMQDMLQLKILGHDESVKNPEDRYILGQIHELKYILVSFFGLTEDELEEIQKDGFAVRDIEHPDKLI